jgi:hypothetical protein
VIGLKTKYTVYCMISAIPGPFTMQNTGPAHSVAGRPNRREKNTFLQSTKSTFLPVDEVQTTKYKQLLHDVRVGSIVRQSSPDRLVTFLKNLGL